MSYVTYKNRTSSDYRFTTTDLNDPTITELKQALVKQNNEIKARRKRFPNSIYFQPTKGIRIRPRGPLVSAYAHDTPWENATHYDVYVREYK